MTKVFRKGAVGAMMDEYERAVAEMRKSDWPHAAEFVEENLLVAADRDEAIASLESRRK